MGNNELTAEDRQEIIDSLIAGKKIRAIKRYRDISGVGLREAKEFIEMLEQEPSAEHHGFSRSKAVYGVNTLSRRVRKALDVYGDGLELTLAKKESGHLPLS